MRNEIKVRIEAIAKTRQAQTALKNLGGDFKSFGKKIADAKFKILGASAAIGGIALTLKKGFDFVALGANIEKQRRAFDNLAESVGTSGDEILFRLKQVSRGTVDLMSLIQSASRAMLLEIQPEKLTKLLEISRAAAKATGDTITKSFNDIAIGIGRQSRLILDNLGIVVEVGEANKAYALQLGKTASELTDTEKRQAFMNATLKAGQRIIDRVGKDMLSASDKVDIIKTSFIEAKAAAASFFKNLVFQGTPGESTIRSLLIQIEDLKNSFKLGESAQEHKEKVNKAIEEIEKKVSGLLLKMQGKREADSIFKRMQSEAEELNQTLKGFDIVPGEEEVGRANSLLQIFDKIEARNVAISESIQASVKEEETRIQQLKEKLEGVSINQLFTLTSESVDTAAIERQIQEAQGRLSSLSDQAKISGPFLDFEKQKELFKKIEPEILATFHKLDTESQRTFMQLQKRFGDTVNALDEALEKAGIKSDDEMQRMAKSAMDSFKIIENSGTVTGANLGAAWMQLREDILPVLGQLPKDFQETFNKIETRFPQLTRKAEREFIFIEELAREVARDMSNSFEEIFFRVMRSDFENFGDFAFSVLTSIQRSIASVLGSLAARSIQDLAVQTFPSLGDVFGIKKAQHGLVATSPQVAIFGEAGPEAVMPLSRDRHGNLGISAAGGTPPREREQPQEMSLIIVNTIDPGDITLAGIQTSPVKNIIHNNISSNINNREIIYKSIKRMT